MKKDLFYIPYLWGSINILNILVMLIGTKTYTSIEAVTIGWIILFMFSLIISTLIYNIEKKLKSSILSSETSYTDNNLKKLPLNEAQFYYYILSSLIIGFTIFCTYIAIVSNLIINVNSIAINIIVGILLGIIGGLISSANLKKFQYSMSELIELNDVDEDDEYIVQDIYIDDYIEED